MLDIGTTYTNSRIRGNAVVNGYTGYAEANAPSSYDMYLNLSTTRVNGGWMCLEINSDNCLLLPDSGQFVKQFKPIVAQSDDRLKENEVITESACGTLSTVKPQLYYKKKQTLNIRISSTWIKESGLIAQETYYDAPELIWLIEGTIEIKIIYLHIYLIVFV